MTENQEYRLTIHLDAEYLADVQTIYPIRIDPTIEVVTGAGAIEDVTINSLQGSDGLSGSLFVGKRATYGISRTLMKFPLLDLRVVSDASCITSATVEMRDVLCESDAMTVYCNAFAGSVWSEGSASWSTVNPNAYTTPLSDQTISYSNGVGSGHFYSFDILEAVRGWKDGSYSQGAGILFKASTSVEQASTNLCKTFASYNRASGKPSLTVTYDPLGDTTEYLLAFYEDGQVITGSSSGLFKSTFSSSNPAQRWVFVPVGSQMYTVRLKNDLNKCLTAVPSTSGITVRARSLPAIPINIGPFPAAVCGVVLPIPMCRENNCCTAEGPLR